MSDFVLVSAGLAGRLGTLVWRYGSSKDRTDMARQIFGGIADMRHTCDSGGNASDPL